MTKRQAITAAISAAIGLISGRAKAEPLTSSTLPIFTQLPQRVYFDLDVFQTFEFTSKGKSVIVTSEEIFEALSK